MNKTTKIEKKSRIIVTDKDTKRTILIEKVKRLPLYDGGYLINTGTFRHWVLSIIKTGTADVLEDYVIKGKYGGRIIRKKFGVKG